MRSTPWWSVALVAASLCACECTPGVQVCSGAKCAAQDAGALRCDPSRTDNATRDTDCDGLSDAEEYTFTYGVSGQTNPCIDDSDGDGLRDGLELGRSSSVDLNCNLPVDEDPRTRTSPTLSDSDGDGLSDAAEDKNGNGRVDPGESDPSRIDSDCDGLSDAEEAANTRGCRSDPLNPDTDHDGLPDGLEASVTPPGPDARCNYPASTFDVDPATQTNACNEDTDGDGIIDGAEDTNANGRLDIDELDPRSPLDSAGPAGVACTAANLRPVSFHTAPAGDIQLALLPSFAELTRLLDTAAEPQGLMFYDATHRIAGLAVMRTPIGTSVVDEETQVRTQLVGMSGAITPWDGFPAVRGSYDISGTSDIKAQANLLAKALLGDNTPGQLIGAAGVTGPFKLQAEYVRRTNRRAVLLFAFTPELTYVDDQVFRLDDVAGGSALAQVGDFSRPQCEVFEARGRAAVDFLWVVDNSCSMASYQQAVGNAGNVVSQKLGAAGLNWRAGAVTTAYYLNNTASEYRPFVDQTTVMQQWFTQNSPTWFGTGGTGNEQSLLSAQRYLQAVLLPYTTDPAVNRVRQGADLHLIVLGDADDQASQPVADFNAVFRNYDGAMSEAMVHGIVCPQGQGCGESQANPRRNLAAIAASGGVLGDINVAQSGSPQLASTLDAIMLAAIAKTGHQLRRPPIAATLKVAIEASGTVGLCTVNDLPRSRVSGFDFDAATRKMVFYGDCRPKTAGTKVAVSYRYWVDNSPDPEGDPCGGTCKAPNVCRASTASCVCANDCGGCSSGLVCDTSVCACVPDVK